MKPSKLSYYSILYVIAWIVSPPLSYGLIFRILAVLAIIIYLTNSLHYANRDQKNNLLIVLLLCAYMVGIALSLGENFNIKIGAIAILLTGISYDIWLSNNKKINKRQLRYILFITLILYCIWNSTTLYCILFENERIMRDLTRNSDFSEAYALRGVGGFGYIYSVILMLPVSIELLRIEKIDKKFRIVNLYFVFTGFLLAYYSEYFIAMLLALLIILLVWKKPGKSTYFMIGIVTILLGVALESILEFMIDMVDIPEINNKLIELRSVLISGGDIEDSEFGVRYERYSRDLVLIVTNPIWGSLSFNEVGKHSEFLDFFAQYGVPLGIVYVITLLRPATIWVKRNVPIANVVLLVSVIMCIMNRFPISVAAPLCFILPTYCRLVTQSSVK